MQKLIAKTTELNGSLDVSLHRTALHEITVIEQFIIIIFIYSFIKNSTISVYKMHTRTGQNGTKCSNHCPNVSYCYCAWWSSICRILILCFSAFLCNLTSGCLVTSRRFNKRSNGDRRQHADVKLYTLVQNITHWEKQAPVQELH